MSSVPVPRQPIVLAFNPLTAEDKEVGKVFRDRIAYQLWLAIKSGHIVHGNFNKWCLAKANEIAKERPSTPEQLVKLLRARSLDQPHDAVLSWGTSDEDYNSLMIRILAGVNGLTPMQYRVIIPNTPEEKEYHAQEHRRGYDDCTKHRECSGDITGAYGRGWNQASNNRPWTEEQ